MDIIIIYYNIYIYTLNNTIQLGDHPSNKISFQTPPDLMQWNKKQTCLLQIWVWSKTDLRELFIAMYLYIISYMRIY